MRKFLIFGMLACLSLCMACTSPTPQVYGHGLKERLYSLIDSVHGTVGIAFVSDSDTVTVNNGVRYPMMSVFKLHQSLAVADALKHSGDTLDSTVHVTTNELDPHTWSPMLKIYGMNDFDVSVGELVRHALISSDNNASNLLFRHIVSPTETDRFIKSVARDTTFSIRYSERDMKHDHTLAYRNHTSPLSAAILIQQLFTSDLVGRDALDTIREALTTVTTGQDRLGVVLPAGQDILFAHKTGSGYRNGNGELTAHNDVGYFRFPDGRDYALAVFIRDFDGTEDEASRIIARISKEVYDHFTNSAGN